MPLTKPRKNLVTFEKESPFLLHLWKQVMKDGIFDLAAALAFYFLFSIFPLLIFLLSLLSYFSLDMEQVWGMLRYMAPQQVSSAIIGTMESVQVSGGVISFSFLLTIWVASKAVNGLIRTLNQAYNVVETRNFIYVRFLSIALTVALVMLTMFTLALPVFGRIILPQVQMFVQEPALWQTVYNVLRWGVGVIMMAIVLFLIYWIAPNENIPVSKLLRGTLFATIGWQLISVGFSYYLQYFSNYSAIYGSLGGVMMLLMWFFLMALIILIGGEINATLYQRRLGLHRVATVNVGESNKVKT
ncbi:YihY/virulence factor BrkB family protein [Mechercharimyces sp. CAU 1602]|uniref:YihY/virulence factor BrkB family protein n=1 Tax=Mechercharimyces sp. CAU 1602 TaxID=2973933 RepID=UPI002163C30B|nr:YihY/virulence factor BrkB family protein [Mechercharimyces sp. CAU 1602]MCS1351645.1 YihY/virulence factor BrkB family protein [Mechercharimyces sp. CAU 1602]